MAREPMREPSKAEIAKAIDASYDEFEATEAWRECALVSCGASFKATESTRYYCSAECAAAGLKLRFARREREARAKLVDEAGEDAPVEAVKPKRVPMV